MVSAVSSVVASRELDGDSGEYGFDSPSLTVVVKYSDSTEYTVKLGNEFLQFLHISHASEFEGVPLHG